MLHVGDWDNSRFINTPGQSGHSASAHYRDFAPIWVSGGYMQVLYPRRAVQAATRERILLVPSTP